VRETPRAIRLRLETGGRPLAYAAGQAATIGLAGRAERKPYSIASSPEEQRRSATVEFLVEVGPDGQASPHLKGVGPGSPVDVEGPAGGFILPARLPRELLFVAGGTGIAPLRAMIGSALARRSPPAITLLYSARTPDEFAFGGELDRLSRQGRIRLYRTATREAGPGWRGRRGRIRQAWLDALVEDRAPRCFVCGPEAFVERMIAMLREAGVPGRNIRREQY
jgi:ferredoxin-NADP reductase